MKNIFTIILSVIIAGSGFAQTAAPVATEPQRVVIELQQPKVPAVEKPLVVKANEWVEFGKNVGTAMDAGLASLSENANKFAKTDAGRFTMLIIAWKVAGREALELTNRAVNIFLGIPLLIAINGLFIWFYRKNYMERRVLVEREGPWYARTKVKWEMINDRDFGEGKTVAAVFTVVAWIVSNAVMISVIL